MKSIKKYEVIVLIFLLIMVGIIVYFFKNFLYRSDNFIVLSEHFYSLEKLEESKGYSIAFIIFRHYLGLVLTIFTCVIGIVISYLIERRTFKQYPTIFKDYQGVCYMLFSLMLLILILLVVIEPQYAENSSFYNLIYNELFVLTLLTIIFSYYSGNKIYNNVFEKIKQINNNNFEDSTEQNISNKKYKIVPFFYILLVIFTITYGYKIYEFAPYIKYTSYPNEVVIPEESYLARQMEWGRAKNTTVSFHGYRYLFDQYKIDQIELKINSEASIEILENNYYQILIEYNFEKQYITQDDFNVTKTDNEYVVTLYLSDYDFEKDHLGILDLTFVNDSKEPFEEQPTVEYNITIVKIK